jgi:hypothetical protein
LELNSAPGRDAQRVFSRFDIVEGLNTAVLADRENQPVPSWEDADGAQGIFFS